MAAETLQTELLAVPGVASAEMDLTDGAMPVGVKVSLSPEADAAWVSDEVQRVLAAHGMRSRFSPEDARLPTEVLPPPVLQLSDLPEAATDLPHPPPVAPPVPLAPPPPMAAPSVRVPVSGLRSVSVEERADGITASVLLDDGRGATRGVGFDSEDLDDAIIAAVAEAVGVSITRTAVEWLEIDGERVVAVAIRRTDGTLAAGASVVRAGRAFAVGTATRSALES